LKRGLLYTGSRAADKIAALPPSTTLEFPPVKAPGIQENAVRGGGILPLEKEVSEEIACERSRYGCPGTNVPALPRSDQQHTWSCRHWSDFATIQKDASGIFRCALTARGWAAAV